MTKWHGGKGSKRRPEKEGAYQDQWEKIFGKKEESVRPYKSDNSGSKSQLLGRDFSRR